MKRTVIIVSIAVALLLLGGTLWYFLGSQNENGNVLSTLRSTLPFIGDRQSIETSTSEPTSASAPSNEQSSGSQNRQLVQIIDHEVLAPTLSSDGKSILYLSRENGRIFSSNLDGDNEITVVNTSIPGAFDAIWAPQKQRVVVRAYENGVIKTILESIATGTAPRFLPEEITSIDWSPLGKIAYFSPRLTDTALILADERGLSPQTVYTTPVPDFVVSWITKDVALLASKPSGVAPSLLMRVRTATRSADVLPLQSYGVTVLPTPDGASFLFSRTADTGSLLPLSVYRISDSRISPLNIITFPEKCVFSFDGKRIYCGVPSTQPPTPSPDTWYQGSVSFQDRIVVIELATNQETTLMDGEVDVDVIRPFLSQNEQYLFFQDKQTGTVWRLVASSTAPHN